jgi:hypothetical protein
MWSVVILVVAGVFSDYLAAASTLRLVPIK